MLKESLIKSIKPPRQKDLPFEKKINVGIDGKWLDNAIRFYLIKNRDFLKMLPKGAKRNYKEGNGYTADRIEKIIDGVSEMFEVDSEKIKAFIKKSGYQVFLATLHQNKILSDEDRIGLRFESEEKKNKWQ